MPIFRGPGGGILRHPDGGIMRGDVCCCECCNPATAPAEIGITWASPTSGPGVTTTLYLDSPTNWEYASDPASPLPVEFVPAGEDPCEDEYDVELRCVGGVPTLFCTNRRTLATVSSPALAGWTCDPLLMEFDIQLFAECLSETGHATVTE